MIRWYEWDGAATINVFHRRGAFVVFGDLDAAPGEVASKYKGKTVQFPHTDASKYEDNLALFRLALKTHGKIDHAFSVASVVEQGSLFDPGLTIKDVGEEWRTIQWLFHWRQQTNMGVDI